MAEEKEKTTTTRGRPKKATTTASKATPKEETVAKTQEVKEEKREITPETQVEVFNNTHGKLVYTARKGNGYLYLENFMDSDVLTVEELQVMKNGHRKMINDGWIYIDDEDVLDYLRLSNVKNSVKNPQVLEEMVDSGNPNTIIDTFEKLGTNSKGALYKIIKRKYLGNEFSNAYVIKIIEEDLGIASDLSLLSD